MLVAESATGMLTGAAAGAHAGSGAAAAPGVLAGNLLQAPVHLPMNLCDNTVTAISLFNLALGNHCANTGGRHHPPGHQPSGNHQPPAHVSQRPCLRPGGKGRVGGQAVPVPVLASTGSDGLGASVAASGALLLGAWHSCAAAGARAPGPVPPALRPAAPGSFWSGSRQSRGLRPGAVPSRHTGPAHGGVGCQARTRSTVRHDHRLSLHGARAVLWREQRSATAAGHVPLRFFTR